MEYHKLIARCKIWEWNCCFRWMLTGVLLNISSSRWQPLTLCDVDSNTRVEVDCIRLWGVYCNDSGMSTFTIEYLQDRAVWSAQAEINLLVYNCFDWIESLLRMSHDVFQIIDMCRPHTCTVYASVTRLLLPKVCLPIILLSYRSAIFTRSKSLLCLSIITT